MVLPAPVVFVREAQQRLAQATVPTSVWRATPDTTKMAPNAWLVKQANARLSMGSQATHVPKTYARAATVRRRRALIARATTPPSAHRAMPGTTWMLEMRVFRTYALATTVLR